MPKFDIPSTKDNHVFGDTAAVYNNAAKDDLVCTLNTQFSVQDLLANDPGAAAFVGFGDGSLAYLPGVTIDELGMISVDWLQVTGGFDYTIRMANGTYSTAHVGGVAPVAGDGLFLDSFETYAPVETQPWGYTANLTDNGWTSAGADTEIVLSPYQGIVSDDGTHWLDTQATSGPIDITHTVSDPNGGSAQITLSVATEQFTAGTTNYLTGGSLQVYWNDDLVLTILPDLDPVNVFQTFQVMVESDVGDNTLQIVDTAAATNVGFAVDLVGVVDWVCA